MGLWKRWKKPGEKPAGRQGNAPADPGGRYAPGVLSAAYDRAQWHDGVACMRFGLYDEWEISFLAPKERAEWLLRELFRCLPRMDAFVGDPDEAMIVELAVGEDEVTIHYWGTTVNTQFDVRMIYSEGGWYCAGVGMRMYDPPAFVCRAGGRPEPPEP